MSDLRGRPRTADGPPCECHGEPMQVRGTKGGRQRGFVCSVKNRERAARHYVENGSRARLRLGSPELQARRSEATRGERNARWKGDDAGYYSLHTWLLKWCPKVGVCEECGANVGTRRPKGTHWAFLRHPEPHTRNPDDYRELCPACHAAFDFGGDKHYTRRRLEHKPPAALSTAGVTASVQRQRQGAAQVAPEAHSQDTSTGHGRGPQGQTHGREDLPLVR